MNALTALRTFGNPRLTPTKHVRIYKDRYYMVRMQNTERDMGDGYYLAEGEYTELVPGEAARQRRDAHLNHCNRIEEWNGPVFAVMTTQYGHWRPSLVPKYAGSEADAKSIIEDAHKEHLDWIAGCERQLAMYQAKYEAKPEDWLADSIENCKMVVENNRNSFRSEVLKVREAVR